STLTVRMKGASDQQVVAYGSESKRMIGKVPRNVLVARPLREGVIADLNFTEKMLHLFLKKVKSEIFWLRPHFIISLPCKVSKFEKSSVQDVGYALGASKVTLVEEPVVAAIGAGMPIFQPRASLIVDIGGGTTEIAVLSMGGIVY